MEPPLSRQPCRLIADSKYMNSYRGCRSSWYGSTGRTVCISIDKYIFICVESTLLYLLL